MGRMESNRKEELPIQGKLRGAAFLSFKKLGTLKRAPEQF
jgi:hypothetical protein